MTNFKKFAFVPALALAAALPFASASAGESGEDIVVTSPGEMEAWQASATRSLNRALEHNPMERTATPGSGIVQVTFSLGADGRPDDIELYSSSANWVSERSAMRAVRRLGDLSDVPVRNAEGAQFLANIIFADDVVEHQELAATLRKKERARLASESSERSLIALGG